MIKTTVWAATHTGSVRARNEDSLAVTGLNFSRIDSDIATTMIAGEPCLAVVADGLGGHPCGELASRLAVEHLSAAKPADSDELVIALHETNKSIYLEMERNVGCTGMGSTIAAVLVYEDGIAVANVGDSGVFEMVDGQLVQLSIDDIPHSRSNLPGLPSVNVTQTLGGRKRRTSVMPHIYRDYAIRDRRVMLCTDGLTSFLPRSTITASLALESGYTATRELLELAIEAGGLDNVTIVILDVQLSV